MNFTDIENPMFWVNLVIALATFGLFWATIVLARYTKKMADTANQPHVVATIEPNRWSVIHFDLKLSNTGNAPAYDIRLDIDPLPQEMGIRKNSPLPLQNISILRPTQELSAYLTEYKNLEDLTVKISVYWKRKPNSKKQEVNSYEYNLGMYKSMGRLGAVDPLTQIAEQIKKLREDWQHISTGGRRIKTDMITQEELRKQYEDTAERFKEITEQEKANSNS